MTKILKITGLVILLLSVLNFLRGLLMWMLFNHPVLFVIISITAAAFFFLVYKKQKDPSGKEQPDAREETAAQKADAPAVQKNPLPPVQKTPAPAVQNTPMPAAKNTPVPAVQKAKEPPAPPVKPAFALDWSSFQFQKPAKSSLPKSREIMKQPQNNKMFKNYEKQLFTKTEKAELKKQS